MAKQQTEGRQESETPAPTTGQFWKFVGLDGQETVHVSLTNRTYVLSEISGDQAEQLLALGWDHIQRV